ncbi:MAG TPA: hypothetical protein PLV31_02140 [Gammaproteobacteria bacterium]|nr:hypothetical protein [Gammaproteobacteria bacterium]
MNAEELKVFQDSILQLTKEWERTLKDLAKDNAEVLTLSNAQAAKLEKEKLFVKDNPENPPSVPSITKDAKRINLEIDLLRKQLQNLINDEEALKNTDKKKDAFYCIQLIQIRAEQLVTLAKQAHGMIESSKPSEESQELGKALMSMKEALFKGEENSERSQTHLRNFFTVDAPAAIQKLLGAMKKNTLDAQEPTVTIKMPTSTTEPNRAAISPDLPTSTAPEIQKKTETVPKWLEEILAVSNSVNGFRQLRTLYQQTKTYAGGGIDHRLARLMQPTSTISKKRAEQLKLIETTLVLLEKGNYTPDEKTRIARGLMLVIKYQLDREHNVFKSRLGTMVNNYLNRTDNSNEKNRNFSVQECLVDFDNFSRNNFSDKSHKKMRQQISTALHNETWKGKQFYSLHQMIDSIKLNVDAIDLPQLKLLRGKTAEIKAAEARIKTHGYYVQMYNDLQQGVEQEKLPVAKFTAEITNAKKILREKQEELHGLLSELENNERDGKDITLTKANLYLVLKETEILLKDYDYLVKIGEEKFSKLSRTDYIEQVKKDLHSLETPLKDLQGLYAHAIKKLPSKTLSADIELAKKTTNKRGLFSLFKSASTREKEAFNKSEAFKESSNLYDKIKAIPPAISEHPQLNEFETAYNTMMQAELDKNKQHTTLLSTEGALNTAKELYKNMNTSSTKNLSATMLHNQITGLTRNIDMEIKNLIGHLSHSSDKIDQEDIYIKFRAIEKQLETLQYLSKIAAIKLDPSVNVVRRVNDEQAKKFQEVFSNPVLLENIKNFEALRTDVLKKIGITPKHRAEP